MNKPTKFGLFTATFRISAFDSFVKQGPTTLMSTHAELSFVTLTKHGVTNDNSVANQSQNVGSSPLPMYM